MKLHRHGDTVVVSGPPTRRYVQGETLSASGRFTDTWMKKNGQWLCIAITSA